MHNIRRTQHRSIADCLQEFEYIRKSEQAIYTWEYPVDSLHDADFLDNLRRWIKHTWDCNCWNVKLVGHCACKPKFEVQLVASDCTNRDWSVFRNYSVVENSHCQLATGGVCLGLPDNWVKWRCKGILKGSCTLLRQVLDKIYLSCRACKACDQGWANTAAVESKWSSFHIVANVNNIYRIKCFGFEIYACDSQGLKHFLAVIIERSRIDRRSKHHDDGLGASIGWDFSSLALNWIGKHPIALNRGVFKIFFRCRYHVNHFVRVVGLNCSIDDARI